MGDAAILVVEDDAAFGRFVRTVLHEAGYDGTLAHTAAEALSCASTTRPALAIVDVKLPDLSGYELCRRLKDRFAGLPVLLISGVRMESYDRAGGLLAGADDYLVKPIDSDELLACVRRQLERAAETLPERGRADKLTPREREVLRLLADGANTHEIADRLCITPKTASTYIERILVKLELHTRSQAVSFAFRAGIARLQ
jgi:two-component system, NarL family, response regulator DevR